MEESCALKKAGGRGSESNARPHAASPGLSARAIRGRSPRYRRAPVQVPDVPDVEDHVPDPFTSPPDGVNVPAQVMTNPPAVTRKLIEPSAATVPLVVKVPTDELLTVIDIERSLPIVPVQVPTSRPV
jgi:hypothetical protein